MLAPGYGKEVLSMLFESETDKVMAPVKEKLEKLVSEAAYVYLITPDD